MHLLVLSSLFTDWAAGAYLGSTTKQNVQATSGYRRDYCCIGGSYYLHRLEEIVVVADYTVVVWFMHSYAICGPWYFY